MNRKELKEYAKARNLDVDFGKLPNMNIEKWRKYSNVLVSNYGNVKDAASLEDVEIKMYQNRRCYVQTNNGLKYVTHLVYDLFYKKDRKNLVIHHIDEDPSNNRVDNLIAVTRQVHKSLHFNKIKSHKPFDNNPDLRDMKMILNKIEFDNYDSTLQKEILEYVESILNVWKSRQTFENIKTNNGIYVNRLNYDSVITECIDKYGKITRKNLQLMSVLNYDSIYHLWYKDNK